MNAINVSVNVTVDFSEETKKFIAALFTPYSGCVPCATGFEEPIKQEQLKVEEPTPVEPEQPKVEEPTPVEPEQPKVEEPVKPAPAISIEDVRLALQEKVNEHREKIKAKLTEFGSANVTKLDPVHYEAMYNFLKNL